MTQTSIKERIKKAKEEYLERTRPWFLKLMDIRQKQNIKYLFNHLNNTLEPIVFESNEEKLVLWEIDKIFNQINKEFKL